ncbi:MAG: hypothetical protein JW871_01770 [Endomicrobiales bacterium]|nr:hypothetical protein [Endomicrobiales bacterium]
MNKKTTVKFILLLISLMFCLCLFSQSGTVYGDEEEDVQTSDKPRDIPGSQIPVTGPDADNVVFNWNDPSSLPATWYPEQELNPHFKAKDRISGEIVPITGVPRVVSIVNDKLVIVFFDYDNGKAMYVSPLAIKSKSRGEHPADKVLRLVDVYKLSITADIRTALSNEASKHWYFEGFAYYYQPGKTTVGLVESITEEGSLVVIPIYGLSPEWAAAEPGYTLPIAFVVNRNNFVYTSDYQPVLQRSVFAFDSTIYGDTLYDKAKAILLSNQTNRYWKANMLRQLGYNITQDEKFTNNVHIVNDDIYFSVYCNYPVSDHVRLLKIDQTGTMTELYYSSGWMVEACPNPLNPDKLLLSVDGFPESDPRFQSLFEYDITTQNWHIIHFPGVSHEGKDELYMGESYYGEDGLIYITRYGFEDEGGGFWVLDPSKTDYGITTASQALLLVDHNLDSRTLNNFLSLETSSAETSYANRTAILDSHQLFFTAKEVEAPGVPPYSMSLNNAVITGGAGMDPAISDRRRVGFVGGWNPVIFDCFNDSHANWKVCVLSNYNFESYINSYPRALFEFNIYSNESETVYDDIKTREDTTETEDTPVLVRSIEMSVAPTGIVAFNSTLMTSVSLAAPDTISVLKTGDDIITDEPVTDTPVVTGDKFCIDINDTSLISSVVDHEWYCAGFNNTSVQSPVVVASIETYNGGDPAGLRIQNLTDKTMQIKVEEEKSNDDETNHATESVAYALFKEGPILSKNGNVIGEAKNIDHSQSVSKQWTRLNFTNTYTDPAVFMQIASYNGGQPAHMRIKNVSTTGCDFMLEEWGYLDGAHVNESISIVVLESGKHVLCNDSAIEVGKADVDHNWKKVSFENMFPGYPVVITRCQTYNASSEVVTRQKNVLMDSFEVKVQEEESRDNIHNQEVIGYMAIEKK